MAIKPGATKTRAPGERKPLSDRQRAHLDQLKETNRQRAAAADLEGLRRERETAVEAGEWPSQTTMTAAGGDPPDDDGGASILQQMADIFSQAAGKQTEQSQVLRDVEAMLGKLRQEDYPVLARNPQIQAFIELLGEHAAELHPEAAPGTIVGAGSLAANKVPWEWRHLQNMELVTFTPNETINLIYNGLGLTVNADVEVTLPSCFYDVWIEHRSAIVTAREHADLMFRKKNVMDLTRRGRIGADPTVIGDGTSHVRASGVGNTGYIPGAGAFNPADEPGHQPPEGTETEEE